MAVVAVIGALTALLAATIGIVQNDIKRVLAYSTVSQLGYMFLALGVGAFAAGIFHLMTHAFFKALLFLGSGSVIHAHASRAGHAEDGRAEEQDSDHVLDDGRSERWRLPEHPSWRASSRRMKSCGRRFRARTAISCLWLIGALVAGMTAFYMFRLSVHDLLR